LTAASPSFGSSSSSAVAGTAPLADASPQPAASAASQPGPHGSGSPASASRRTGLSFCATPPPKLSAEEKAAIDAAVQAGKVTVVPTGASGVVAKGFKGTVMQLVPPPFPDATEWEREAAVTLQKCGVFVVTTGPKKWLIDGRVSVTSEGLVERANKKRAARKLPPIEIPGDGLPAKKRGAA
jgi:hypothetical protein